jgi:uncharacterized protein (TIGR03066 family)
MKGILAAFAATIVVVGTVSADDKKIDPAKLVGKWELTKSTDKDAPIGAIVEFTKDNKITFTATIEGKPVEFKGTYKVDGDKLTVKLVFPGGKDDEDTDTIKSLSDDMIVLVDKNKKETELKKKK